MVTVRCTVWVVGLAQANPRTATAVLIATTFTSSPDDVRRTGVKDGEP
jgi:hypothetical protein